MLSIRFQCRVTFLVAITIFGLAVLAENVTAQEADLHPSAQVGAAHGDTPRKFSAETYKVLDTDDAETRLMKELITALNAEYDVMERRFELNDFSVELYCHSLQRLTEAQLEFHTEPADKREILEWNLQVARKIEAYVQRIVEHDGRRRLDLSRCRAFRLKAELALLRFEKAQAKSVEPETNIPLDGDDAELRLIKELIASLQSECEFTKAQYESGLAHAQLHHESLLRLTDARLEFHTTSEEQFEILKERLEIAKQIEAHALPPGNVGNGNPLSHYRSVATRIQAELALLRFENPQSKNLESKTNHSLDGQDAETRLMKEHVSTIQSELEIAERQYDNGDAPFDLLLDTYRRLIEAQWEFSDKPDDLRRLLEQQVETFKKIEASAKDQLDAGVLTSADFYRALSARIEAELAMLRFEKARQRPLSDSATSNNDQQRSICNDCCECTAMNRELHSFGANSRFRCSGLIRPWVNPLRGWFRRYR